MMRLCIIHSPHRGLLNHSFIFCSVNYIITTLNFLHITQVTAIDTSVLIIQGIRNLCTYVSLKYQRVHAVRAEATDRLLTVIP